jgi:hypothetical protein
MPHFLLHHRHGPSECAAAFAAWKGFESTLRREPVLSTCLAGGHELWWRVDAATPEAALAELPAFVARRSTAIAIREVRVP